MDFSIETVSTGGTDNRWLTGSHGKTSQPGTLDLTAVLALGATAIDGFGNIVGGIAVGQITATKRYVPWTSGAVDGSEVLAGYILAPVRYTTSRGVNLASGKVAIAVLKSGTIKRTLLPIVAQRTTITPAIVSSGQFIYAD